MPNRKYYHRDREKEKLILETLNLPQKIHDQIVSLVANGYYVNKTEFMRHAIKNQLEIDMEDDQMSFQIRTCKKCGKDFITSGSDKYCLGCRVLKLEWRIRYFIDLLRIIFHGHYRDYRNSIKKEVS